MRAPRGIALALFATTTRALTKASIGLRPISARPDAELWAVLDEPTPTASAVNALEALKDRGAAATYASAELQPRSAAERTSERPFSIAFAVPSSSRVGRGPAAGCHVDIPRAGRRRRRAVVEGGRRLAVRPGRVAALAYWRRPQSPTT